MLFSGKFKDDAIIWLRMAIDSILEPYVLVTFTSRNRFTITSRDGGFAIMDFQIGPQAFDEFHCDDLVADCWLKMEHLLDAMEMRTEEEDITLRALTTVGWRGGTSVQLVFQHRQTGYWRSILLGTWRCMDPDVHRYYFTLRSTPVAFAVRSNVFARTILDLAARETREQRTYLVRLHQLRIRVTIQEKHCHLLIYDDEREVEFEMDLHFTACFQLATDYMGEHGQLVWLHKPTMNRGFTHVTCELSPFLVVRYVFS